MSNSESDETYQKSIVIAVPIVFAFLSTVVFVARLYARRFSASKFGIDDLLMAVGLLLSFGATTGVVWTGFNGAGQSINSLPKPERQRFSQGKWIVQKFWPTSLAFVKCSIIVFMQRLFRPHKRFLLISNLLIIFVSLREAAAVLTNTFQCWPVQYFYNKTIKGGHCMKEQTKFYLTMGAMSLIEDVAILILPQPVIWQLHLDYRKKLGLAIVFSLGMLVCIFSLLRLVEFRRYQVSNLPASSVLEEIFTCLEIDMAILCGCLPPTNALFKSIMPKSLQAPTGSTSNTYNTSSSNANRFKRKGGSVEDEGFERIVDLKASQDVYGSTHDSGHAMELGAIEVHTDLDQHSDKRKLAEETGVTSTAWPR